MKRPLNTLGVGQVQTDLFALTDQELQQEIVNLKQDFSAWMERHFELSASQMEQINEMPDSFRDGLTNAIASNLENRRLIAFSKQEKNHQQRTGKNPKDVIILGQQNAAWRVGDEGSTDGCSLSIQISYE